jgi:hypothetical protein
MANVPFARVTYLPAVHTGWLAPVSHRARKGAKYDAQHVAQTVEQKAA